MGTWNIADGQTPGGASVPDTTWDRHWKDNDDILRWAIAKTNRDPDWTKKYVKEILPADKVTIPNNRLRIPR